MTHTPKIYLTGAGPGDPELLTVKARRLLEQADLVLHDDLVPPAILRLAGVGAQVINVGKRCGAKGITQEEINERMIDGARRGLTVVRLKSGDPGIFGRLAEELDALDSAGLPYEVVPGITAGIAAAAELGVSLTDRRRSARVVVVTGHRAQGADGQGEIDWSSLAREDATLVVYMPGREFVDLRRKLLQAGLPPEVPAVLVSRATTPEQRHRYTTVGGLDSIATRESPSILLIGWALEEADERSRAEKLSRAIDCAEFTFSTE